MDELNPDYMLNIKRSERDRILDHAVNCERAMHDALGRLRGLEGVLSETRAMLQAAERHAEESRTKWSRECNDLRARLQRLRERPKLWVVRYPNGLHVDGLVHVGDCGSPTECIAAFDRKIDADYVAGCIGGEVEEWRG